MKNKLLYIILPLCLTCGCNAFLDEEPDNRAKVETPGDLQELLVNAYPQATYHLICEMMSDNVKDRGFGEDCVTAVTDDEMYNWREGTDSDYDSPFALWSGLYEGISSANYAIRVIESKPDWENYRPMLGEALLCRAFNHFLLVNLWAEHYDPATAATALGIPYVTEPETVAVKEYTRNTVEETYRLMEEDIRRGIQMIDDRVYEQPKFHFTKRAAHAFATRFYAYKGNEWEKVLYHSLQAAPEDFRTEIRNVVQDYSIETPLGYAQAYTDPGQSTILLSVCVPTYYNEVYARCPITDSRYVLTPALQSEIFSQRFHSGTWRYRIEGLTGTTVAHMLKNYAYFKSISATSSTGMTYVNVPMLTVEDVVLNRMEAYVMLGDTVRFLRDMNRFLPSRTFNYNASLYTVSMRGGSNTNSLVDYFGEAVWQDQLLEPHYKAELEADECKMAGMMAVVFMRRREFMQEGMRWFDIKRFHLPVTHYRHWERDYITLGRYDGRRMLQIPQEAQKVGVQPNQRDIQNAE
ncbi:MAG: RagB/SusD family nutrient uptake outer membrane protein [Culturomica sp.]|jgi:hypothetical protein|nr:RagB/SusD family nutrient uptake outer membrane protein [Culturomica sp.]